MLSLLDRHSTVLASYRWTEFDDEFLTRNVESVALADLTGPKVINRVLSSSVNILLHELMSFYMLFIKSVMFLLYPTACGSEGSQPLYPYLLSE